MAIDYSGYYTTSSTTYSTAGDQVWYWYDEEGNLRQGGQPSHTHEIPNTHGNWSSGTWQQSQSIPSIQSIYAEGEEVMRFNKGVEMKVNGKWVKVESYLERLDMLDKMMERMYELLSPWQRKKLMFEQLEKQTEDFEHFDPDLFKV